MSWVLRASLAPADCLLVRMLRGTPANLDGLLFEANMVVACNGYIWARRILEAPTLVRDPLFIRSRYIRPYLKSGVRVLMGLEDGSSKGKVQLEPYDERLRTTEFAWERPALFGTKLEPPDHIVEAIANWQKGRETINRVVEERPPVFKDIAEIGISPRIMALLASILPNNDNWRGPAITFRIRKPTLAIEFSCGDLVGLFMPNDAALSVALAIS